MRRMIDPKQLGGGQQEQKKYYNHFITLSAVGLTFTCYCTIVNDRPDPYTEIKDLYQYLKTSSVEAQVPAIGYYNGTHGKGIVESISLSSVSGYGSSSLVNFEIENVENVHASETHIIVMCTAPEKSRKREAEPIEDDNAKRTEVEQQ